MTAIPIKLSRLSSPTVMATSIQLHTLIHQNQSYLKKSLVTELIIQLSTMNSAIRLIQRLAHSHLQAILTVQTTDLF